ncbi:hypothetical protein SPV_2472 [Streptococcus pneumoniae]|nr:hypothetical protein SPV_2472 [Streptococcus pneumoniae]
MGEIGIILVETLKDYGQVAQD